MSSPFDRLPSELLSYIFTTLKNSCLYARSIGDVSYGRINYPILVSSICVRWRQVAISTPSLWSFLDFDTANLPIRNIPYLGLCYERSANAPLTVRLGRYDHECNEEAVDEQLASLLSSYAPRLDSLAIASQHLKSVKEILSILLAQGAIGRVRKLALYVTMEQGHTVADTSISQEGLDELLKPLHTLCLDHASFDWNLTSCGNLVNLELIDLGGNGNPSPLQLVRFLNENSGIRRLKLAEFDIPSYELSLPPIKLPELQSLEIDMSPVFISWFFALLVSGAHELSLRLASSESEFYIAAEKIPSLYQFFQRARIVSLGIEGHSWLPFADVIAYLPHLETLGVYNPGNHDYSLTDANMQTNPLPKLHTVELVGCSAHHMESGLGMILRLPSVKHITFSDITSPVNFMSAGDFRAATANRTNYCQLDTEGVKELMDGLGITAHVSESTRSETRIYPSPFM